MATESVPEISWDDAEMKKRWDAFAKFGNASAVEMTGKNFDKWLKDAGVIDKHVTTTMTGIAFSKVTGPKKKTASYADSKKVLVTVAEDRARQTKKDVQTELDAICEKLAALEAPSRGAAATRPSKSGVVDRLTNTTGYTGSHKERFDESGKGKGKAGREDLKDDSGYVGAYKNKGTYDEKHS